jgi:hypothetical protein
MMLGPNLSIFGNIFLNSKRIITLLPQVKYGDNYNTEPKLLLITLSTFNSSLLSIFLASLRLPFQTINVLSISAKDGQFAVLGR